VTFDNVDLFPVTAGVNAGDHLVLGGCDTVELTRECGSPLLVFDEETRRFEVLERLPRIAGAQHATG